MAYRPPLKDFLTTCERTTRLAVLWRNAVRFFQGRGIEMISYHSDEALNPDVPRSGIIESGYPREWVSDYMEGRLSLIDPMPDLASRIGRPFFWSEVDVLAQLSAEERSYMQRRAESDLGDGLAFQVYGPSGRNAHVCLGFGAGKKHFSAEEIFELQCAAQIAHLRYCTLSAEKQRKSVELSPRELEVLRWIARGKSNSVIADILGISRHTVDTMTRRMFEKLEVHDRTTAAVRGLGSGLLRFRREQIV